MPKRNTLDEIFQRLRPDATGCLVWPGAATPLGYGKVRYAGDLWYVHRLMYVHHHGKIPDGMELDHLCRNPRCANPRHLEAVTASANCSRRVVIQCPERTRKRVEAARSLWQKVTHCKRGHPFDDANTYYPPRGRRQCRECARIRQRKQHLV